MTEKKLRKNSSAMFNVQFKPKKILQNINNWAKAINAFLKTFETQGTSGMLEYVLYTKTMPLLVLVES